MVAAIGAGATFSKGRDFAAWLGLVPRQMSTGDRTILGSISKRGNRYLRALFVQAAWVVLVRPKNWERHGLKSWIDAARKRLHHNVLAIALATQAGPHRLGRPGPRPRVRADIRALRLSALRALPTLPAEVCERVKRDGGSVFPAPENPGDPNGPTRSDR
jgi:Transposase IS116/IS110/IS902 family